MTIAVDFEELVDAHATLAGHAESLRDMMWIGRMVEDTLPSAGPTRLVAAMGRANQTWLRVAEQVMEDLEVASRRLLLATEAYRITDDSAVGR